MPPGEVDPPQGIAGAGEVDAATGPVRPQHGTDGAEVV